MFIKLCLCDRWNMRQNRRKNIAMFLAKFSIPKDRFFHVKRSIFEFTVGFYSVRVDVCTYIYISVCRCWFGKVTNTHCFCRVFPHQFCSFLLSHFPIWKKAHEIQEVKWENPDVNELDWLQFDLKSLHCTQMLSCCVMTNIYQILIDDK